MSELINIENVDLGYSSQTKLLLNINLKIYEKDFIVIKGDNGSGKSTFLKLLYMKILPVEGKYFLFGNLINNSARKKIIDFRKKLGVILQNNYLIPYFTVYKNVELPIQIINKDNINLKSRVREIISWVGLEKMVDSKIDDLSEGQKQKVIIARSLVSNPRILIADEPLNNLDEQTQIRLSLLFDAINKLGTTIIISDRSDLLVSKRKNRFLDISEKKVIEK